VDLINLGSSDIPARKSDSRPLPSTPREAAGGFRSTVILGAPDRSLALQGATIRRLVADRTYFGLEAQALRAGAERALARLSAKPPGQSRIDVRSLGEDFRLDPAASSALQREFLMGGLIHPDGAGGYLPSRLFRQYALACVVALAQTAGHGAAKWHTRECRRSVTGHLFAHQQKHRPACILLDKQVVVCLSPLAQQSVR